MSSEPGRRLLKAQEIIRALEEELQQADHGLIALTAELEDRAERLQASEERYRRILDSIEDGYYETDRSGNLTFFNDSLGRILGRSSQTLLGMNYREYMDEESIRKAYDSFEQVRRTGDPIRGVDWQIIRPDGVARSIEVSVSLVAPEADEPAGFRGIVRDVTERRRTQEALRQSEHQLRQAQKMEAVGRLAGGVAHDFNNVLTAIKGYAQFALEDLPTAAPLRSDIQEIVRAADRARDLTRQLLAFSRQQVTEPRVLDVADTILEAEKMLRRLIGDDVLLEVRLHPRLGRIRADPVQVEQILVNLAVNAKDAMPQGGRLTIHGENIELDEGSIDRFADPVEPGPYVRLAVSDTGTGIESELQEHIFEPFFTTKVEGKGTGLGLSTVYGIVRQAGGHVAVDSHPGEGTTFEFYLPRTQAEPQPRSRAAPEGGDVTGSETVLLVEDQPSVRMLVRRTLQKVGYRVVEATNGEEALSVWEAAEGPIELLLTDVVMPRMGGRALARRLRELNPDLRVLYMSGYAENEVAQHGILEPGTQLLEKPFEPQSLRRKVRDVLDSGR